MLFAPIFRGVSLQICRLATAWPANAPSAQKARRQNPVSRGKPVRGAASEPHCTEAGVIFTSDGRTEGSLA
jgi:hypothetical protein